MSKYPFLSANLDVRCVNPTVTQYVKMSVSSTNLDVRCVNPTVTCQDVRFKSLVWTYQVKIPMACGYQSKQPPCQDRNGTQHKLLSETGKAWRLRLILSVPYAHSILALQLQLNKNATHFLGRTSNKQPRHNSLHGCKKCITSNRTGTKLNKGNPAPMCLADLALSVSWPKAACRCV